jgi:hypothetical protein
MDRFYEYHRSRQISGPVTDWEKRNLSIIEGAWIEAQNSGLSTKVVHPERFRMQWPVQKCSCNLSVAKEVEVLAKEAVADRTMRLGLTYAKGNQVAAEGVVSWSENGVARESPFISFLLLDRDGLVIRERRYVTMDNCPGAAQMMDRLGLSNE